MFRFETAQNVIVAARNRIYNLSVCEMAVQRLLLRLATNTSLFACKQGIFCVVEHRRAVPCSFFRSYFSPNLFFAS